MSAGQPSEGLTHKRSLHRSQSVMVGKKEGSLLSSRVASTMSAGSRRGSNDEAAMWYGSFSQEDIDALATAALTRLRTFFLAQSLKPIVTADTLKALQESCGYIPPKKKWWKLVVKKQVKEEKAGKGVMNVALCKSIEYSSHACANNDTTFNLRRIPILIHECMYFLKVNGLKSNGIFRVNGSERRMAQLALVFDQGPKYGLGFTFEGYTVYDVADFLKRYVRSLPEPLLTTELYPFFLKCLEVPVENGSRIKAFRWLIMLLPPPHLVLLEQLLELFSLVVGYADTNQMTSNNLARIFSPNILKPRSEKQALEEFQSCSFVVEFMIENWEQFSFTAKDMRPFEILDTSYLPKRKAYVPPVPVAPLTSAEAGSALAAESHDMPPLPALSLPVSPPLETKADDGPGMERTLSY